MLPIHLATVTNIISLKHCFIVSFLCLRIYSQSLFPVGSSLNLSAELSRTLIAWLTVFIQFYFLSLPRQNSPCQSSLLPSFSTPPRSPESSSRFTLLSCCLWLVAWIPLTKQLRTKFKFKISLYRRINSVWSISPSLYGIPIIFWLEKKKSLFWFMVSKVSVHSY